MYKLAETNMQNTAVADFCIICTIHYNSLSFQFSLYIDKLQV